MPDVLTLAQRRRNMAAIRSKDTTPEIIVRRMVHALGFRYRLHSLDLPGKPDLVLPKHQKVIFVHGCFWHMHRCKFGRVTPRTNALFWQRKRVSNVARDRKQLKALRKAGWTVLVIWECETRNLDNLEIQLGRFLGTT